MMNVKRYKANGSTHKKGTGGMLMVILLVVATSNMTPEADNKNHNVLSRSDGKGAF